ncbi:predicted protein [Nematostella vectensis]|uniref:Uncharacterized protein n=1 Tax=Nematostella vectensis TaxID=45351 RepID=A7S4H8_NEMVE|nr:predicted protein [Nematostella vectensis]|eukprot:XP_001633478.1 predicted protein [Nematostella vectensis]
MAMFNERLIKWTNEQEERQYTFTITEADVTIPWSGPRLRSLDSSNTPHSKSESDLRRYQALPPIGCQEPTNTSKQRRKSGTPPQPSPPESFWLHLGVTARTHMIAEFHRSFPENTNEFIIDQRYVVNHEENKETGDLSALVSCTNSEMNVITDVMSVILSHTQVTMVVTLPHVAITTSCQSYSDNHGNITTPCSYSDVMSVILSYSDVMSVILRGLLEDSNFHGSLGELDNEPVPYFRQLGETPYIYDRTPSRASSSSSSRSEPGHEYPDEPDLAESRAQESSYQVSYHDDRASSRTHEIVQRSSSVLSAVDHLRDESLDPEWKASQRNKARSLPEFTSLLESVIENSLLNIMTEANYGELSLTARPRVIALPPSRLAKR